MTCFSQPAPCRGVQPSGFFVASTSQQLRVLGFILMGQLTTPFNASSLKHLPLTPKQVLKGWGQPQLSEISSRPLDILQQHVRIVHQQRQTSLTEKLEAAVQGLTPFTRKVRLTQAKTSFWNLAGQT